MLNSLTLFKAYVFRDGGNRLFCTIRKNNVVTFLSKPAHPGDLLFRRGFTIWFFKAQFACRDKYRMLYRDSCPDNLFLPFSLHFPGGLILNVSLR